MRAPAEVRLERFQYLIERISYESERGAVIVVEGQRDRDSLRRLGITGPILCLQSSRKNTIGFVEELDDTRDVIVLTDFDREGVFLAKRLARILSSQRVRADLILWRDLRRLTRTDVRSIEELPKFYHRLQTKCVRRYASLLHGYETSPLARRKTIARRDRNLEREHSQLKETG